MDSVNIGKSVNFDVIIAKKIKIVIKRIYYNWKCYFNVADLRKNSYVVYVSEKKVSSYHGFIENVFDYDGEILCKVS